jgi:hypothetical protein
MRWNVDHSDLTHIENLKKSVLEQFPTGSLSADLLVVLDELVDIRFGKRDIEVKFQKLSSKFRQQNKSLAQKDKNIDEKDQIIRTKDKDIDKKDQIIRTKENALKKAEKRIVILLSKLAAFNESQRLLVEKMSYAEFKKIKDDYKLYCASSEKRKNTENTSADTPTTSDEKEKKPRKKSPGRPLNTKSIFEREKERIKKEAIPLKIPEDPTKLCRIPANAFQDGDRVYFQKVIEKTTRTTVWYSAPIISVEEAKVRFAQLKGIDNYSKGLTCVPDCFGDGWATPSSAAWLITTHVNCNVTLGNITKNYFLGTSVNKSMLDNVLKRVANWFTPMYNKFIEQAKKSYIVYSDETGIKILNYEKNNQNLGSKGTNRRNSYIYSVSTGIYESVQLVVYKFHTSRSGAEAKPLFENGEIAYLVCDGWDGYNIMSIPMVRCWVHARRKFIEIENCNEEKQLEKLGKNEKLIKKYLEENAFAISFSKQIITLIGSMYKQESEFKSKRLNYQQIKEEREKHTRPIINEIFRLLEENKNTTITKLHKAIKYVLDLKDDLCRFFEDGRLPLDNNLSERNIRKIVTYRNNSYFCINEKGADKFCILKSVSITAQFNGLHPARYIEFLLNKIWEEGHYEREKIGKRIEEKFIPGDITKYLPWSKDLPKELYYTNEEEKEADKIMQKAQKEQTTN